MISAIDAARFLIAMANASDESATLTQLRLQKLLYYAQAWSVALRDRPVFGDRVEAWVHGPVVPSVYVALIDYKDSTPIPPVEAAGTGPIPPADAAFLTMIWDRYRSFSAPQLREMTHREPTWVNARAGLAPSERSNREIRIEAMAEFFTGQVDGLIPGIPPVDAWAAEEEYDSGKLTRWSDVKAARGR